MLELKGGVFKSTLGYIRKRLTEEERRRFLASLSPRLREFLDHPILASKFYTADLLIELAPSFVEFAGLDPGATYLEMGRISAEEGFKGVYKVFLKVGTPSLMLRSARNVYRSYYSQGEMKVEESAAGMARIIIVGSGIEHVCLCSRISGFIERTMEMSGGKDVILKHRKCFQMGDTFEEWEGTWR